MHKPLELLVHQPEVGREMEFTAGLLALTPISLILTKTVKVIQKVDNATNVL